MPLISMRQILDHAAENGYGVPAFNINDMEQVLAVLQAASIAPSNKSGISRRYFIIFYF